MVTKLVENINNETWNKLVGYSKIKGKKVGTILNEIIEQKMEQEGIAQKSKENHLHDIQGTI